MPHVECYNATAAAKTSGTRHCDSVPASWCCCCWSCFFKQYYTVIIIVDEYSCSTAVVVGVRCVFITACRFPKWFTSTLHNSVCDYYNILRDVSISVILVKNELQLLMTIYTDAKGKSWCVWCASELFLYYIAGVRRQLIFFFQ